MDRTQLDQLSLPHEALQLGEGRGRPFHGLFLVRELELFEVEVRLVSSCPRSDYRPAILLGVKNKPGLSACLALE